MWSLITVGIYAGTEAELFSIINKWLSRQDRNQSCFTKNKKPIGVHQEKLPGAE